MPHKKFSGRIFKHNFNYLLSRWSKLIDSNPSAFRRFKLTIYGTHLDNDNERYYKLKYQRVEFINLSIFSPDSDEYQRRAERGLKIIDFHKKNIKDLMLKNLQLKFVVKILKRCKNLTKLDCEGLYGSCDENQVEFPGLKELKIYYESDLVIKAENLENLLLNSVLKIEEILKLYPKVKHLKIENIQDNFKFTPITQKLTKLEIKFYNYNYWMENLNLIQLLISQKENLRELILYTKNHEHEIEFAIHEMKVEKLTIQTTENFERKFKVNESIKNLTIKDDEELENVEEKILKILQVCQKVENLTLDLQHGEFDKILEIIPQVYPELKNLNIFVRFYSLKSRKKINLSSIENLSVYSSQNVKAEYLRNLLLNCENLKKVKINFGCSSSRSSLSEEEMENLSSEIFKNLKYLEVIEANYGIQLSPEVVKVLSKNTKLKILKLQVVERNYEEQLKLSKMVKNQCVIVKKFCH